jgi:hypothetical protein
VVIPAEERYPLCDRLHKQGCTVACPSWP